MPVDFTERQYISQGAADTLGLTIIRAGVAVDVDGDLMTVRLLREQDSTVVFERTAERVDVGTYTTTLTAEDSAVPGYYTVVWTYSLDAVAQELRTYVEIGRSDPDYDRLSFEMKAVVDLTWERFADLFDSPNGGPNLMTYFQSNYDRGRMAKLLKIALGTLNTVAQPYQTYTLDGVGQAAFPVNRWGPLLEKSLYIECLKHLRRSYVEQPMFVGGGNVTRLDRRDYLDRWGVILQDEQDDFRRQLEVFKIANMGLGKPAVLVAGGSYGRYGPTRLAGSVAARPRMWSRWYAVVLIGGGALLGLHSASWHHESPGVSTASTQIVSPTSSGRA